MKKMKRAVSALLCIAVAFANVALVNADSAKVYSFSDPGFMSDADFFGVYDSTQKRWTNAGKINYEAPSGTAGLSMDDVKKAVMNGDYASAKIAYKQYYVEKSKIFGINRSGSNTKEGRLASRLFENQMLYNANAVTLIDIFSVGQSESQTDIDFTSDLKSVMTQPIPKTNIILASVKKDGSSAEFASRTAEDESERPFVEVSAGGSVYKIYPSGDTYISAGINKNTNYGNASVLRVEESVSSRNPSGAWEKGLSDTGTTWANGEFADENTKRAYLSYDFSELKQLGTITKATLKLSGKNIGNDTDMEIAVFRNSDTTIAENTLTWSKKGNVAHEHAIFNFDGFTDNNGMETIYFARPKGAVSRYVDDTFRIAYLHKYPVNQFAATKDEYYGYIACKMYGDFIKMRGGTPGSYNTLDAAVRLAYIPEQLCKIIESKSMSAELFCSVAKYIWSSCDYLQYSFRSNSNWGSFQIQGMFTAGSMFNEFKDYDKWVTNETPCDINGNPKPGAAPHEAYTGGKSPELSQSVAYRLKYMLENVINSDYGSTEKALGYVEISNNLLISPISIAEMYHTQMPYSDDMKNKLVKVEKYLRDVSGPGNCEIQWGNAGTHKKTFTQSIKKYAEAFGDESLLYSATFGEKGEKPGYTSVLYPATKVAVMRSGWNKKDSYLHTSFDGKGTHAHRDDLSMIIMANGEYLLSDQMYGDYESSDGVQKWCESAEAHNVVMIGDDYISDTSSEQPGTLNKWVTNDGYDFFSATKPLTNGSFTRNIYFIRPGYWIVNDYLVPNDRTSAVNYRQLWHMPPDSGLEYDANLKKLSGKSGSARLQIVPAETEGISCDMLTGKYGGGVSTVYEAQYADLKKTSAGITTYNTVIRPESSDEGVTVNASMIPLGDVKDNGASAIKINITTDEESTESVFYTVNDMSQIASRTVGDYTYNGKTFFAETNMGGALNKIQITDGDTLKRGTELLFKSNKSIDNISVAYEGENIYIHASGIDQADLEQLTFIKQATVKNVYFNGNKTSFRQSGGYVYFSDEPIMTKFNIISPKNEESVSGDVLFKVEAPEDCRTLVFLLDGVQTAVFKNPMEGELCSFSVPENEIACGKHSFGVASTDIYGKSENKTVRFYAVQAVAPEVFYDFEDGVTLPQKVDNGGLSVSFDSGKNGKGIKLTGSRNVESYLSLPVESDAKRLTVEYDLKYSSSGSVTHGIKLGDSETVNLSGTGTNWSHIKADYNFESGKVSYYLNGTKQSEGNCSFSDELHLTIKRTSLVQVPYLYIDNLSIVSRRSGEVIAKTKYSVDGVQYSELDESLPYNAKFIKLMLGTGLAAETVNGDTVKAEITEKTISTDAEYNREENSILVKLSDSFPPAGGNGKITLSGEILKADGTKLGRSAAVSFYAEPNGFFLKDACVLIDGQRVISPLQLSEGNIISGCAVLVNNTSAEQEADAFLAFYADSGELQNITSKHISVESGKTASFTVENPDVVYADGTEIKIIAVDSSGSLRPLGAFCLNSDYSDNAETISFANGTIHGSAVLPSEATVTFEEDPDCIVIKGGTINPAGQTILNLGSKMKSGYTEMKFWYDRGNASTDARLRTTGTKTASEIIFKSNSQAVWATDNGSGGTNWNYFQLRENDWNTIRIRFDAESNTQTAWINGRLIKENQFFREKTDYISRWVYFYMGKINDSESTMKISYVRTW